MANGIKIPGWATAILTTLFLSFLGFWGMWSVARADVDNLKGRVSSLEDLPTQVAAIQTDLKSVKESQTEMRQDIKTLLQRSR